MTPITALITTIAAMMIASDDALPEAAREDAEIIAEQSTRMTQIIRELLDFSRSKPLARSDIRIGDVVEHAISLIEPVCEKKRVTLAARGFLDGERVSVVVLSLAFGTKRRVLNNDRVLEAVLFAVSQYQTYQSTRL
mgnify:CR=1 FL=1